MFSYLVKISYAYQMYGYPMLSKEIRAILLSQRLLAYDSFVPLLNVKNFLGVSSNLGIKGLSTLVIKKVVRLLP